MRRDQTPDPVPIEWLRNLLNEHHITQLTAAELLHVDARTVRKWCCSERRIPWMAAELLRRLLMERFSKFSADPVMPSGGFSITKTVSDMRDRF